VAAAAPQPVAPAAPKSGFGDVIDIG
jgi:hypothetical protein